MKTHSNESYELAKIYGDGLTETQIGDLAQTIQDAIEDYLQFFLPTEEEKEKDRLFLRLMKIKS